MKKQFFFMVIGLALSIASCRDDTKSEFSLNLMDQSFEFVTPVNESSSSYSSYYINGIKKSSGELNNGERNGDWVVYHSNGKILWEGFYVNGKRFFPNHLRNSKDTLDLEYKTDFSREGIFRSNTIEYFNLKYPGHQPEDFVFTNLKNCRVSRCNNLSSGGYEFKLEILTGDSIYYEICTNLFGETQSLMFDTERIQ